MAETPPRPINAILDELMRSWQAQPAQTCTRCGVTFRGATAPTCFDCDERELREAEAKRRTEELIRRMVPPEFVGATFAGYRCPPGDPAALSAAEAVETGGLGLYLWSRSPGSGKSHLAFALALRELRAGKRVVAVEWSDFLARCKAAFNAQGGETETSIMAELERADMLVLDDLGTSKATEWATGKLWELVNARYTAKRTTVLTANFGFSALDRRLGGDVDGGRIVSRLSAMCRPVEVRTAGDYRARGTR